MQISVQQSVSRTRASHRPCGLERARSHPYPPPPPVLLPKKNVMAWLVGQHAHKSVMVSVGVVRCVTTPPLQLYMMFMSSECDLVAPLDTKPNIDLVRFYVQLDGSNRLKHHSWVDFIYMSSFFFLRCLSPICDVPSVQPYHHHQQSRLYFVIFIHPSTIERNWRCCWVTNPLKM